MNYFLIKNKYQILEYDYPDIFDVVIYYIDENYCQINVKRLDSSDGWGLILQIKINDNYNNTHEIITFGDSTKNSKILYFKTDINLTFDENNNLAKNI
jgi:hypothetical protein